MRILQIGNFDRTKNFNAFYNSDYKIFNGLVRNGNHVLQFSDRDIARESTPFNSKKFGVSKANKRVLEVCENFQPEFVFVGHADIISLETLLTIKEKYRPKIAQYNVDPLFADKNIAELITYYKENDAERRRIAENGWLKSQKLSTEIITKYMIDVTMGRVGASTDIWGDK